MPDGGGRSSIPFSEIAAAALAACPSLLERWFPAGAMANGHEFVVGNVHGDAGESLSINTKTGKWADFAADAKGGDLISLRAAMDGTGQADAARALAEELGIELASSTTGQRPKAKKKGRSDERWTPVHPVPDDAAEPQLKHPAHGQAVRTWAYRDPSGALLGYVCRFEPPGKDKEILPLSYAVSTSGQFGWRWLSFEKPRPLYGLDRLAKAPAGQNIVITEGEKAADAAQALLPGTVVMTWPGGGKAWGHADWSPLAGRKVLLWPDADTPGLRTMWGWYDQEKKRDHKGLAQALLDFDCDVRIVSVDDRPPKWDAADYDLAELGPCKTWLKLRLQLPAVEGPPAETRPVPAVRDPNVPSVRLVAGDLPRIVDAAEEALITQPSGVYQRGSYLVRVADTRIKTTREREVAAPRIVCITPPNLTETLTRHCFWEKFDGRANDYVACDCPPRISETLLAREGQWRLPVLTRIIEAPTLRPDGSLLTRPGYDPETGLYLVDGAPSVNVADAPTRDNALASLDTLLELIDGFPFVTPEPDHSPSRSVALSAILSAIVRPCLPAAPLHAISAPEAGSGKTFLCELVGLIATGRPPGVITQGRTEEEFEKVLGAELIQGSPITLINNCSLALQGDKFCQVLTQSLVKTRVLEKSELVETLVASFFLATGNNLEILGDMTRRALLCRIDPGVERPELREFDADPVARITRSWGEFLSAALTILRGYQVAGRPDPKKPLLGFQEWSALVRSALCWLGQADPCETMDEVRANDSKRDRSERLFMAWFDAIGQRAVTSKEIIEIASKQDERSEAFEYQELRDILLETCADKGFLNALKLGKALQNLRDRVFGNYRLEAEGKSMKGQRWVMKQQ